MGEVGNVILSALQSDERVENTLPHLGEYPAFNCNPISYVDPDGRMSRLIPPLIPKPSLGGGYIQPIPWTLVVDIYRPPVSHTCIYKRVQGHWSDMWEPGYVQYWVAYVHCEACPSWPPW